jgi:hypothetical protein
MVQNPFSVDVKSAQATSETVINVSNFFITETNKNGYMIASDLINLGDSMRPKEKLDFIGLFKELEKGTKMDYNLAVSTDRAGRKYIYPKFFYARGVKGYKILVTDGILRLIEDYVEGKIKIAVSVQDLAQHALKD